jgi:hypothetical protein
LNRFIQQHHPMSTCSQIPGDSPGVRRSRALAFLEGVIVWAVLMMIAAPSGFAQAQTPPACLMSGAWSGIYSGMTTNKDGNPVNLNGFVTAQFSQVGFSYFNGFVEAAGYQVPVSGSNSNGKITMGPVDVNGATASAGGSFGTTTVDGVSLLCGTVSGKFNVIRPSGTRPISGVFTITTPVQIRPKFFIKTRPSGPDSGTDGMGSRG